MDPILQKKIKREVDLQKNPSQAIYDTVNESTEDIKARVNESANQLISSLEGTFDSLREEIKNAKTVPELNEILLNLMKLRADLLFVGDNTVTKDDLKSSIGTIKEYLDNLELEIVV